MQTTHPRGMKHVLWAAAASLLAVGCGSPDPATAPRGPAVPHVVGSGSSLALEGAGVVAYGPLPGAREQSRFLRRGQITGDGCAFADSPVIGPTVAGYAEWALYYDLDSCTQVVARGPIPLVLEPAQSVAGSGGLTAQAFATEGALNDQASVGVPSGSGGIAGSTHEIGYTVGSTKIAYDQNITQFRYTLNPDCIIVASTVHWSYGKTINDWHLLDRDHNLIVYPDFSCNLVTAQTGSYFKFDNDHCVGVETFISNRSQLAFASPYSTLSRYYQNWTLDNFRTRCGTWAPRQYDLRSPPAGPVQ